VKFDNEDLVKVHGPATQSRIPHQYITKMAAGGKLKTGDRVTITLPPKTGVKPSENRVATIIGEVVDDGVGDVSNALRFSLRHAETDRGGTALHVAAEEGLTHLCGTLVKHGANPDSCDSNGERPIHLAAMFGHPLTCKSLIDCGSQVDVDGEQCSPLLIGASSGCGEVCRILLEHGANVEARDACHDTVLMSAAAGGYGEVCNILLEHGADVEAVGCKADGITPLITAAITGHHEVCEVCLKHGASVNTPNAEQLTPLHCAALGGHAETCGVLIEHGANMEARDKIDTTPLIYAASLGHAEVCRTLLKHGANIQAKNGSSTPLLNYAVRKSNHEVFSVLLAHGADLHEDEEDGEFDGGLFHHVLLECETDICRILIDEGHLSANDVDGSDSGWQWAPIHWAARNGTHSPGVMIRMLVERGANVNLTDYIGNTPLHLAIGHGEGDLMGGDVVSFGSPSETAGGFGAMCADRVLLISFLLIKKATSHANRCPTEGRHHSLVSTSLR
jgi:ankyrin repeat protein